MDRAALWALRSLSFIGVMGITAAAGQYPATQLWNPPGSGKLLLLRDISVSMSIAGQVQYFATQTEFANLSGGGSGNKYLGGAAASAVLANESSATPTAGIVGLVMGLVSVGANASFEGLFQGPVIIGPGNGLTVTGIVAAATFYAQYEWDEVPG